MKRTPRYSIETIAAGFLGAVVLWSVVQVVRGPADVPGNKPKPVADAACIGTPIRVDYPYAFGVLEPHACAVQCADQTRRYILYSNGRATQCQELPGCNDWGEDSGVTCVPPEEDLRSAIDDASLASQ